MPQTKPVFPLTYDKKLSRYRDAKGRFIKRTAVRDAAVLIGETVEDRLVKLSADYKADKITLLEWQIQFKDELRAAHGLAASLALGGKANMTTADWGRVGALVRAQYATLNNFALQLEQGRPMHLGRVRLYARAVRATFLNAERLRQSPTSMARWVRHARESCPGCLAQAARGAQPVASFPAIGSQRCYFNCKCEIVFD